MAKIWVETCSPTEAAVRIHSRPPIEHHEYYDQLWEFTVRHWRSRSGVLGTRTVCREEFERLCGCEVPPQPYLLELEFQVTRTKLWVPGDYEEAKK